ncbi:MAG: VanZ family protein [Bryobacteraceae bacterium]
MKRVLVAVVVLILYGSFYPWQFYDRQINGSLFAIFLQSWPHDFDRFTFRDTVVNIALYVPFGMVCFFSIGAKWSAMTRGAMTLAAGVLLSGSIEYVQLFDRSRTTSLYDVLCNAAGTAAGVLIATTFPKAITGAVSGVGVAFRVSGPIALLYLWAGRELFPFFPSLSQYTLRQKLTVLVTAGGWPIRDFLEATGAWLAVFVLLEYLAGPRRAAQIGAISLLLIPLKLVILHRTMSGSELAGAILGALLWGLFRRFPRPAPAIASAALAALVLAQLLPWRTGTEPQPFCWIPFLPSLSSSWDAAFLVLLGKAFLFGSVIWLWRQTPATWLVSSFSVAIPLAVTEGVQIYLPGRTPEITDAIVALIMGLALWRLERRDAGRRQLARG